MSRINKLISVCTIKDIQTWIYASKQIIKFIPADAYEVIVPKRYLKIFEILSCRGWVVVSEEDLTTDFSVDSIKKKLPTENKSRAGWYFQQLLKIQSLINSANNSERMLIWDADTIPLKKLEFFIDDKAVFFTGTESHAPYFSTIKKLLNYEKSVSFSFIAQCLPVYSTWINEFKKCVENHHKKSWFEAILDNNNLYEISGFSEYETLGTFFVNNFLDKMLLNNQPWSRKGGLVCLKKNILGYAVQDDSPAFLSYETGEQINAAPTINFRQAKSESDFLKEFFDNLKSKRSITQVGANDGVMSDPLYEFLSLPVNNDVSVTLIEPLDYYYEKLQTLHKRRPNTILLKAAVSNSERIRDFYYIDPTIASELNGDGPMNDWAHGQGSFYKESVNYWIDENAFRGQNYVRNIERYKKSILKTSLNCLPLRNIKSCGYLTNLLVIDVHGAELDILLSIDWTEPPDFIYYEQDIKRDELIEELLNALGYQYLCGETNLVVYNTGTVAIVP
jgi:hypothetical protein